MNRKELYAKVDKILWEEWDPIGVRNFGGPKDEYQGYVPSIVQLLEADSDELKIAKLLLEHANVNMGLSTELNDHHETAVKLKKLIE